MISEALEFAQSLLRPVTIVMCGILMVNFPTMIYKTGLNLQGILYLLFCNDKSWKKPKDPSILFDPLLKGNDPRIERKSLYFVRHGESTWNDTFNKGQHRSTAVFVLGFIPGLIKAIMYELYFLFTGKMDSWFYDAPLSYLGLCQVQELKAFLSKPPATDADGAMVAILRDDRGSPKSKIVCSSLRRAVSTMAGGFQNRFAQNPMEQIAVVLPSLQEISRNPDTLAITPAHAQVTASWIDKKSSICDFQRIFSKQVDMSLHTGNKPIRTNGLKRMDAFCEFVFSQKEEHIIAVGHSIYFRSFFKTFLPYQDGHVAKKNKIINCGVVALDLLQFKDVLGKTHHMIDPKSIRVVYGGFA